MIAFRLACVPPTTTAQMKGVNTRGPVPRFFKKAKTLYAEHEYAWLLAPHKPAAPLTGPVELVLVFTWPHLTKTPKRLLTQRLLKTTKPDADNAAKGLIDMMLQARFFVDDALIARLVVEKWHGPTPGIDVYLRPLP